MASKEKFGQFLQEVPSAWLVAGTVIVLCIAGLFFLVMMNPQVLLILFAGLFLGIAIKPAVDWMARRGLSQEVGAALIFIFVLFVLGVFIGFVLPLLTAQTINLTTALADGYANVRQSVLNGTSLLLRQLVLTLPEDIRLLQSAVSQSAEATAESSLEGAGSTLQQVFGVGLGLIFVLFLAVNWSVEGNRFLHTMLLLSNQRREFIREKIANLEDRISRYLRGLSLLSLIVGALALVGYLAIGLPYAVILAVFAGIMEAVPVIGPALGAVPAIMIALSISPGAAIAVIVISVVIQVAENIWIFPRVMGSSLGVPPFLTLVVMLIFSTLFGAVGAFIAIPLAAVGKVLLDAVGEYLREQAGNGIGRDRMSVVRYEIQELIADIRSQARSREIDPSEEMLEIEESLEAIAVDLDMLLKQPDGEQPR